MTTTADGINAKGVSIRWRASDLITATTTSSSQTSTSTNIRGPTATSTMSPQEQSSSSSGLSTGAKAGIGAGISVGALLVCAVIALVWMLRRKNKNKDSRPDITESNYHSRNVPASELEDNGAPYWHAGNKNGNPAKDKQLHEIDSKQMAAELPAQSYH